MDFEAYFSEDKVLETINYMTYSRTKEELDVLFADAIEELLEFQTKLKEEIEKKKLKNDSERVASVALFFSWVS